MVDRYVKRAAAIFSRDQTLRAAKVIHGLPIRFTMAQFIIEMGLGKHPDALAAINREVEALMKGGLLRRVKRGTYERAEDPYWGLAADLHVAWSVRKRVRSASSQKNNLVRVSTVQSSSSSRRGRQTG